MVMKTTAETMLPAGTEVKLGFTNGLADETL
jgi:hypothetical protein